MTKYGRNLPRYTKSFKKELVKLVMENKGTCIEISKKYGVSSTSLYRWLDKYGESLMFNFGLKSEKEKMEKEPKEPKEEYGIKKLEVEELKEALRKERLKRESYEALIKIAEAEYKISIVKKYGTKQSKK